MSSHGMLLELPPADAVSGVDGVVDDVGGGAADADAVGALRIVTGVVADASGPLARTHTTHGHGTGGKRTRSDDAKLPWLSVTTVVPAVTSQSRLPSRASFP